MSDFYIIEVNCKITGAPLATAVYTDIIDATKALFAVRLAALDNEEIRHYRIPEGHPFFAEIQGMIMSQKPAEPVYKEVAHLMN